MFEHPPGTCAACDDVRRANPPRYGIGYHREAARVDDNMLVWHNNKAIESITDTQEEPMDRLEVIKSRMAELEKEAAALEAIPNPADYENEAVISFERSFDNGSPSGKWYVYVAVKGEDRWFLTGSQDANSYTDAAFRELLASPNVRKVFRADGWVLVAKGEE